MFVVVVVVFDEAKPFFFFQVATSLVTVSITPFTVTEPAATVSASPLVRLPPVIDRAPGVDIESAPAASIAARLLVVLVAVVVTCATLPRAPKKCSLLGRLKAGPTGWEGSN
jgi:hypothetical protein